MIVKAKTTKICFFCGQEIKPKAEYIIWDHAIIIPDSEKTMAESAEDSSIHLHNSCAKKLGLRLIKDSITAIYGSESAMKIYSDILNIESWEKETV